MIVKKAISAAKPLLPILRRFPRVQSAARHMAFRLWQIEVDRQSEALPADIDVNRTLWIDPEQIRHCCDLEYYQKYADRGKVVDGDWDLARKPFADLEVYQAFTAHFVSGQPWTATPFYQRVLGEITSGLVKWDCRNEADLKRRFRRLDELFAVIKRDGFRPQGEIADEEDNAYKGEDEISVRIARDGELLFEDGRHRLAMAKILAVPRIPIKVTARHSEWVKFRREILHYAAGRDNKVYQPLLHPDLETIPSHYDHKRYELIRPHLPAAGGTLLDIGCHWGYFCQQFEPLGFACTAVESDEKAAYFLRKLRDANRRRFKIVNQSIFDFREQEQFDVVLALNIFHHFLKSEALYEQLKALLDRVEIGMLIFQAHQADSFQMEGAYRDFDPETFVQWVAARSGLEKVTCLGETADQRPIYKLERAA